MAYKIKFTLDNDETGEYGVADTTITPTTVPSAYTKEEYDCLAHILTYTVPKVVKSNLKKVEIERE